MSRLDRFWRVLLAIVAVAFLVRFAYVTFAKAGPCEVRVGNLVAEYESECTGFRGQASDQIFYNAEANRIALVDLSTVDFDKDFGIDHGKLARLWHEFVTTGQRPELFPL